MNPQLLLNLILLALFFLIIFLSTQGFLDGFIRSVFPRQVSSNYVIIGHVGDVAAIFGFGIAMMTTFIASWKIIVLRFERLKKIESWIPQKKTYVEFVSQLLTSLFIFLCLYFYILDNSGFGLSRKQLLLFPFWFLVQRLSYILSKLVSSITNGVYSFGLFTSLMQVMLYGTIFAKTCGYSVIGRIS